MVRIKGKRWHWAMIASAAALLLAVWGCSSSGTSGESAVQDSSADAAYAEYVGYQFSGADPWEGILSVTVRSIDDGVMEWTFADTFEGHTLYQVQEGTAIQDGIAEFDIQGEDVEDENTSFTYQGTLELKDGNVVVTLESGAVTSDSPNGGESYHMAEALADSGLSNQVVLEKDAES